LTPIGVTALAGRYELRSVDGRAVPVDALGGALGGEVQLAADGRAMRVVRYATSGIPGPIEIRGTGTYRVRGSQITLALDETGPRAGRNRRQVSGDVKPPLLVLRYRRPAGGIIEERYVRRTP
jgi:hypothetical protein